MHGFAVWIFCAKVGSLPCKITAESPIPGYAGQSFWSGSRMSLLQRNGSSGQWRAHEDDAKVMKRPSFTGFSLLAVFAFLAFTSFAVAASPKLNIIPLDQIHAGMKGVAYTVFEGVKPEPMEVEVLGVMKNVNGPKGDVILVRLHGRAEYTGVVAGMSGSPVYLNGKLAGALAFRIGEFSKEPIAGVTPIGEMLEIQELDKTPAQDVSAANGAVITNAKTSGPGASSDSIQNF